MLDYSQLIIGCPTWNVASFKKTGRKFSKRIKSDFSGKTAAFFGCGDQVGYSDNFLDAIGFLAKPFVDNGGNLIGKWSTDGYEFDASEALDGDEFLGLGLITTIKKMKPKKD